MVIPSWIHPGGLRVEDSSQNLFVTHFVRLSPYDDGLPPMPIRQPRAWSLLLCRHHRPAMGSHHDACLSKTAPRSSKVLRSRHSSSNCWTRPFTESNPNCILDEYNYKLQDFEYLNYFFICVTTGALRGSCPAEGGGAYFSADYCGKIATWGDTFPLNNHTHQA